MFKKNSISIIAILILFVTSALFSQPEVKFNSLNDKLPFDNTITTGKLDNGLTYYIKNNAKPEKRVELRLVIKAGSILEDDDQQGLAHFLEHMLFNGTESFPKNELVSFLEKTGIRFGADLNASTGFDRTMYMLTLPTDDQKLLEQGMQVLEEWAHKASLQGEEIDKERGVIMEEWRLGKGAGDRIQKIQLPKIMYNSRYANRLPIGDTNVIMTAPYDALRRYYRDWYRPDLMAVVAVGDFDKTEMEALIKKHFSRLKMVTNPKPRTMYDLPKHQEIIVSVDKDKEMPMTSVELYYKHPKREEGTYGTYRTNLVENIVNSMINSRFMEISRSQNAPFLGAQSMSLNNVLGYGGLYIIGAAVKEENLLVGYDRVVTEANRYSRHGFTATELQRAKDELLSTYEQMYNERDKSPSAQFANEYARHFEFGEGTPGIEYELGLAKKFVPEITLDEVNKAAKSFITDGSLVITISGPDKESLKYPTEDEVRNLYTELMSQNVEPYVDNVSSVPLFSREVTPGTIKKKSENKNLGTTEWELSNGAKVVLKPTDFKNDEIVFQAFKYGGTSLAADKDYVSAESAVDIIEEAGLSKFTATDLQKLLTGKVVSITPFIDELSEGFRGSSSTKDFEIFLQLLNLYFTEPRLDYESYQVYYDRLKESIKNNGLSPESAFRDTFNVVMAQYHYRERPMTEELLKELDADKAYEFFKSRFSNAGDFKFYFVGNFKPQEIEPMILKYIGSLPAAAKSETWKDVGINTPKGRINKTVYKGIEKKGSVRIAITGKFEFNAQNRYLLRSMLDLFNIKLRERIREDKGGVYGIGAGPRMEKYPDNSYRITIGFGCDPDRIEELSAEVENVIKEMKDSKPEELYMTKVKETQRRTWEVNQKENNFWLNSLFAFDFNAENAEELLKYPERIKNLKPEDIQKAAKQYFTDNFVQVVLKPETK